MSAFQLTEAAYRDLDEILARMVDEGREEAAYDLRSELFQAFAKLSDVPGLGHKRPDLTHRAVVFFLVEPYMVIFDRWSDPLTIYAVLHGSRDVKRIPRSRPM